LRIVCRTGDVSTTTVASVLRHGTYRANAVVPAGGIGMLSIRAGGRMLAITNW
jgi:hypothetical protein